MGPVRGKHAEDVFDICRDGTVEDLKDLLAFRDCLELRHEMGWTPLIVACHAGNLEIVKQLIDLGADVNAANEKGTTVFMYAKSAAMRMGSPKLIDLLIAAGADPNLRDHAGKTALEYAIELDCSWLVRYLEEVGCVKGVGK